MNKLKELKAMDLAVIGTFLLLVIFTIVMIVTYYRCYSIPDTLCTCVYSCFGGEFGVLGWIKTSKDKQRDRRWQKEDYEQYKEEQRHSS